MPNRYHNAAGFRMSRAAPPIFLKGFWTFALLATAGWCPIALAAEPEGAPQFRKQIEPILIEFCIGCHNAELKKGGITFEQMESGSALLENRDLWWKALKMLRAGLMPPRNKPRPSAEQIVQIENWIKGSVFKIDPKNPDPGRVT